MPVTAEYTRIFEEQRSRLVAYARSLTGDAWVADDLVAEARFRMWRRLSAGHTRCSTSCRGAAARPDLPADRLQGLAFREPWRGPSFKCRRP
ncbi:sigma factor [Streptomyces sp. NPDC015345]|uniref:sigma factor n=1 Tax=Streptomyces sp. NPDC015345 TaxID=3364953 RepID=UPI0036F75449